MSKNELSDAALLPATHRGSVHWRDVGKLNKRKKLEKRWGVSWPRCRVIKGVSVAATARRRVDTPSTFFVQVGDNIKVERSGGRIPLIGPHSHATDASRSHLWCLRYEFCEYIIKRLVRLYTCYIIIVVVLIVLYYFNRKFSQC